MDFNGAELAFSFFAIAIAAGVRWWILIRREREKNRLFSQRMTVGKAIDRVLDSDGGRPTPLPFASRRRAKTL